MRKFKVSWYDQNEVVFEEGIIFEAKNKEECERIAYARYNGKPPAPCIFIEEIEE